MTSPLFCSSVAIVGALFYATGRGKPLLGAIRFIVYARAVGYMAASCWEGARLRLGRWEECVGRARREI
jgi:hypothetical protein